MNNWLRINCRYIFLIIFVSLICVSHNPSNLVFAQNNVSVESVKPTQAIEKVLSDQVKAWNKGDLEGFMAGYWKSPDLSFYSGKTITHGWQPTLDRYRKRYQSEGKEMGTLAFNDLEIEMLGQDTAFVRGKWQLQLKDESVGGVFTLILKKLPEGWRIIHDHTSG